MTSIGTTVTPAILPGPKLVPESFSGTSSSALGADQKAAALARAAVAKAVAQLAADTKANIGANTIRSDQQAIAVSQAAAVTADAKVQQDPSGSGTGSSSGVNLTV